MNDTLYVNDELFLAEVVKQSEKETEMETETSVVKTPPPRVSMSKVTRRGDTNDTVASFAPDDTTFSAPASVTSFDFKPLSPASAAVFLFPNQDSNACASFFETKPSRLVNLLYEPVREKHNNLGSYQVRHKPGCTVTEDG